VSSFPITVEGYEEIFLLSVSVLFPWHFAQFAQFKCMRWFEFSPYKVYVNTKKPCTNDDDDDDDDDNASDGTVLHGTSPSKL